MPKVTFLPIQKTYEARAGESLLDVAVSNDIPIQHACGGFCACTTCHVKVRGGAENLSPQEDDEVERIEFVTGLAPESRLACQARVEKGDVTVEIVNLDL